MYKNCIASIYTNYSDIKSKNNHEFMNNNNTLMTYFHKIMKHNLKLYDTFRLRRVKGG